MEVPSKSKIVFDPLYGFINLTTLEWEIIHTPFYQRLRWIKQLGFTFYTFPGAEHSRYGHSIGVMFNAHKILQRLGKAVSEHELLDDKFSSSEKSFHQSIRLAALLHDLGTFMFSHTTEMSYIRFGETTNEKQGKGHPDDHEHLGSYIIKNTDYPRGITYILKQHKQDPQKISNLVKGVDPSILACQILHSEVDCDRMDYLLRDAHYSGIKYGTYDRDYLLHHFRVANVNGHDIVAINHNALHAVEDFLMARFAWYSQVIRSARGARFDAIAEEICFYMLEKGKIYSYSQLMDMIANDPDKFYTFNDQYFMQQVHLCYTSGKFDKNPRIKDLAYCLLFAKAPKTIRCEEFKQRILSQDEDHVYERIVKKAEAKIEEIKELIRKKGTDKDWILEDLPKKNIIFVKSRKKLIKSKTSENLLLERDPVKILMEDGDVKLLGDVENSIISDLQTKFNFVPNVYCSDSAFELLKVEGIIT
ncbi:MAG TPA: HD domain-containing protein [Bacteriovoracaceae bacterium]|nr:HD domain-containing protein [Bacteriovoracaceae bacterium]